MLRVDTEPPPAYVAPTRKSQEVVDSPETTEEPTVTDASAAASVGEKDPVPAAAGDEPAQTQPTDTSPDAIKPEAAGFHGLSPRQEAQDGEDDIDWLLEEDSRSGSTRQDARQARPVRSKKSPRKRVPPS